MKTNTPLPQTIVEYTDGTISVLNLISQGTIDLPNKNLIRKVIVGNNCTVLRDWFKGATNLSALVIDSPNVYGTDAFRNCTKLKSIMFTNNVTNINRGSFAGCTALSSVKFPDSVKDFGYGVFEGASNLTVIDFGNTRQTIPTLFDETYYPWCTANSTIYVPDKLYDDWVVANGWRNYNGQIHRHSELEAPYAINTALSALEEVQSKVKSGAETGTTGTPDAITRVASVYETDWSTLSANADVNTLYVVVPDPV